MSLKQINFIVITFCLGASFCRCFGGGPLKGDRIPLLLDLIQDTQRGLVTSSNDKIKQIIDEISYENSNKQFTTAMIDGSWELLWTTEKETLFFARSGLFGKNVSSISQSINFKTLKINNLIEFDGERFFSVDGKIVQNKLQLNRVNFEFEKATISIPPFPALSLPPVGRGWFENVFVNSKYRLSRDIRGDYLISKKITK